jgi:excisionase family DNA binding protein
MSYLTTRDLQELIRVDKSTIYRMADAGRLPAVKVGRQWRFPEDAVMAWLGASAPPGGEAIHVTPGLADLVTRDLAQSVADLAADAMGVMVVITDMDGSPLTSIANPCGLVGAMAGEASVLPRCVETWRHYGTIPDLVPRFGTSEFGFLCARAFVRRGSELLGMVIAGGVATDEWPPDAAAIRSIATTFGVPEDLVAGHIGEVFHLTQEDRVRVLGLLPRVGVLISQMAAERVRTTGAFEAIADLAERRTAS